MIRRVWAKIFRVTLQNEKVDMPAESKAEKKVETLIDTLYNAKASYCSILWLKG